MAVNITLFRWAGSWGPFNIRAPCGECSLTSDVIVDAMAHELSGVPIHLDIRDWLSEWWRPFLKGGWHAPIVLVDGRVVSQGSALNRGVLSQSVIEAHAARTPLHGNILFGKHSCPHCKRARKYLEQAHITYDYRDVIKQPVALYEMLVRVKSIVGNAVPITVPQIWLEGDYIGNADALAKILRHKIKPNPERGQCSLSPP
ncbi:MAG: glutaredoxin [Mariprofundaceae bacterium]|nr:glutaredoxin [Mariprofundaceae bacterium]